MLFYPHPFNLPSTSGIEPEKKWIYYPVKIRKKTIETRLFSEQIVVPVLETMEPSVEGFQQPSVEGFQQPSVEGFQQPSVEGFQQKKKKTKTRRKSKSKSKNK